MRITVLNFENKILKLEHNFVINNKIQRYSEIRI